MSAPVPSQRLSPAPAPAAPSDILAGPLHRPLLRLAVPLFAAYLLQIGFNWVDTLLVARLGAPALAAVGSSMFVVWGMMALLEVVSVGTMARVARQIGAGQPREAGAAALAGGLLALALSVAVAALSPPLVDAIVRATALDPEPAVLARDYLQVLFWGYPTLAASFLLEAIYRGAGESRTPMAVLGGSFLLNALLDWLLIFGWGPIPALGVAGAAWATVASRGLGAVLLLGLLWKDAPRLGLGRPAARPFALERLGRIVRIGAPASAAGLGFCVIYLVLVERTALLGGTAAVAALGLGIRVENIAYLTIVALGRAAATIAGQNLGARQPERARAAARRACWIGCGLMLPVSALLLALPEQFVRLFLDDPAVTEAGVAYLRIVALALIPMVFEVVLDNVAAGVGDTVPAMGIELVGTALRIPLAWGLAELGLGYRGVFWAIGLTMIIKGAAFELWFRRGRWQRAEV